MLTTASPRRVRFDRAHDSPDTAGAFAHLAGLDEGRERELLREEVVEAWLPMAHRIAASFRGKACGRGRRRRSSPLMVGIA